jgi:hypothetical protein
VSHIPPPTLQNLTAEQWRLIAATFGWTLTLKQKDIAWAIYRFNRDRANSLMDKAVQEMQAACKAKDYKAFYKAQAKFDFADHLFDETTEYYARHIAGADQCICPTTVGVDLCVDPPERPSP